MKAYPDTSFLCALYRLQANSAEAERILLRCRDLWRLPPYSCMSSGKPCGFRSDCIVMIPPKAIREPKELKC